MDSVREIAPDKPELAPQPLEFPVVGVGASAGGLEAFERLLRAIDPGFEAAYILVQHLDPNHESMLSELLARHTRLGVVQIGDGTLIRPRNVYIIPSASGLTIEDGVLNLVEFEAPRGFRRPIDDFFQALALDQGPNAVAVVLTGTGSDGAVGIRHVKEAAGLTIVQDPDEAAYDGMPASAVATGVIDKVLPVGEIPAAIVRFFEARRLQPPASAFDREGFLNEVMNAVRGQTGHDFSYYKINTVLRRIQRRMQVCDLVRPEDYVERLRRDPSEAEALFQDLLINVTAFFRDPEVFDLLRRKVIPDIMKDAGPDRPVRVWVPGCSSGEEAYSLAMLIAEARARMRAKPDVEIFATDIDEDMLQRARRAVYRQSDVSDIPPELLERYFTATEDGYAIVPAIRDMVRVSAHSVIKDPPFSRLNLISCRNLLIYFDARLQARLLPLFHYGLRPDGWLLLGSAENLAGRDDLFTTVAREERVYRKQPKADASFVLPLASGGRGGGRPADARRRESPREARDEREARVTRRVMERYASPHVVVDAEGRVQHASARTAPYLHLSIGAPSQRVLDLAPSELRPALRSLLGALAERRRRVIRRGVQMTMSDDEIVTIDLVADPIDQFETMIVFRERARVQIDENDMDAEVGDFRTEERIRELEDELSETRTTLRTTVEELETSNEELKSSNEEMMSMNEELQSANEELSTVNEELKMKLDELARLNADQTNFLESTRIATVFVDRDMRVRSFTPVARRLFRFVERDKGRPLLDVRTTIDVEVLREAVERALAGELQGVRQLRADDGGGKPATYTFRALPYLDHDGAVDGAVLVFDDVSELVRAQSEALGLEQAVAASRLEIERLYETAPIGMALIDKERRYRRINESLARYNGAPAPEHLGRTLTEMLPEIGPKLDAALDQVFETGEGLTRWEMSADAPTEPGHEEVFELDIYPVDDPDGEVSQVGIIVHRVTEARRMEREIKELMAELQHRVKNSLATVMSIVRQTVRSTSDPARLAEVLSERIGALAATHSLLTSSDWSSVPLRAILDQELRPYGGDRSVTVGGPALGLGPKAAITLTLVLHELATNAAKYGALATRERHLAIEWSMDEERFRLEWRERGAAAREPDRLGFGLRFIERIVAHDLGGRASADWSPDGLSWTIEAPRAAIAPTEEEREADEREADERKAEELGHEEREHEERPADERAVRMEATR